MNDSIIEQREAVSFAIGYLTKGLPRACESGGLTTDQASNILQNLALVLENLKANHRMNENGDPC